jgi:murein hydrolase activator
MKIARSLTLALCLTLPNLALAASDEPVFAARNAAENLRAATQALTDAREARDRVSALSNTIRAYEQGLQAMRESLRRAAIREYSLKLQIEARRNQLSQLLGVLQTLERASTPLLLIHPSGPLDTARSGQILSEVTPSLLRRAEDLRAELEEMMLLQALQTAAKDDLESGLKAVQDARVALTKAIGERTNLPKRFISDAEQLDTLLRNSETLNGFAHGLADLPFDSAPEVPASFAAARGKIPLPVFGALLRRFNEADASGLRHPGIILSAPSVSLVTAPFAATIRYLGPLLDYGNVIILEPEAGYLIVLAGLGEVYGEVGQILSAGDPVGLLRGSDPAARDFLVEASQGNGEIRQETLYIEIRQDRNPVDPGAWFALADK